MLRVFSLDMADPEKFVITLELVPGIHSKGKSLDNVLHMAEDAFSDGRISAVSITDNPGGNPSLSPDAIGTEIFRQGMDVIVHFTCRDMNRGGMESRALQLAMLGIRNILALSGDYTGRGFGGQGAPVFDLDSVNLICMLKMVNARNNMSGDPEDYFIGSAVSPFKSTKGESYAQYAKMSKKAAAGTDFFITQLGFDARKFHEIIKVNGKMECHVPMLASLYVLNPGAAGMMNKGRIPGCVVSKKLLHDIEREWQNKKEGQKAAIERAARLGVILKGLGYKGIHISGIHKNFDTVGSILDRMDEIENDWKQFVPQFEYPQLEGYYMFPEEIFKEDVLNKKKIQPRRKYKDNPPAESQPFFFKGPKGNPGQRWHKNNSARSAYSSIRLTDNIIRLTDKIKFKAMDKLHNIFFNFDSPWAPLFKKICQHLDKSAIGRAVVHILEDPAKIILFSCKRCGDCGIQHLAFQCPESCCPKHTRNGACGGSLNGMCEVRPDHQCVWYRAYNRLESAGRVHELFSSSEASGQCVPPRMWELNGTSSWLNFHLGRDHQTPSIELARLCSSITCSFHKIEETTRPDKL